MQPVAEQLDAAHNSSNQYLCALLTMQSAINDSSFTPSASMLKEMQDNNETYYRMAMRKAQEHRDFFLKTKLDKAVSEHYSELATLSHKQQAAQENDDQLSFDKFLSNYWVS